VPDEWLRFVKVNAAYFRQHDRAESRAERAAAVGAGGYTTLGSERPRTTRYRPTAETSAQTHWLEALQFAEANSKRVPTLFWMNASGKRAAKAWVARQPVQWHGTR
jgi:hypothetical protein